MYEPICDNLVCNVDLVECIYQRMTSFDRDLLDRHTFDHHLVSDKTIAAYLVHHEDPFQNSRLNYD